MANTNEPWKKYSVGLPSTKPNWTEPDCQPFSEISHVTHLESALNILSLKKIQAGLIFDKSKLNNERILVNWLSPNSWSDGYRYGNIRFIFDFNILVQNKNYYWVEDIAYGIAACRILITSKIHTSTNMIPYDPTNAQGPWYHDNKKNIHYYNPQTTLEIMIEEDLLPSNALKIDFVDHHKNMCNNDYKKCADLGLHNSSAAASFISRLISRGISTPLSLHQYNKNSIAFQSWLSGIRQLSDDISLSAHPVGKIKYGMTEALENAKIVIISFAYNQSDSAVLTKLFASDNDLKDSIRDACAAHFGFKNFVDMVS